TKANRRDSRTASRPGAGSGALPARSIRPADPRDAQGVFPRFRCGLSSRKQFKPLGGKDQNGPAPFRRLRTWRTEFCKFQVYKQELWMEQVVIIGSGPAAHTAAIYAGRANLQPLMFEGFMAGGVAAGGQLTTTTEIENSPGFVSIDGTELMNRMREQSVHCGTRIRTETVTKVEFGKRPFRVHTDEGSVEAMSVIIATGATAKRMHVPGEEQLWQRGISACAVCDGALPLFRNQELVVVGGGDTAVEEATH